MEKKTFSGRYEILENLGKGGLGEVHRALDLWNKREVALKVATAEELAEDGEQSFKSEFLLLKELVHPGIVEVYDFGYNEDGRPYFSMEYVKGKGIDEAFKERGYGFLYRFIWEISEVLGYLHARGIVHCDLKKDNLKVVESSFGIKLLDFGLSEKIGSRIGRQLKGTLDYMAPEVFSGGNLDGRTDLYSLGVILYEVVTSQLPFPSEDPIRVVAGHLEGKAKPPRKINPKIPAGLSQLIMKLLSKSPEKRYRNVQQLKAIAENQIKHKKQIDQSKLLYSHIHSGRVVAREKEFSETLKVLKQGVGLKGKIVLLEGETGIGKSVFLAELKVRAELEGLLLIDSRCLEGDLDSCLPATEVVHNLTGYLKSCFPFLIDRLGDMAGFPESKTGNEDTVTDSSVDVSAAHKDNHLGKLTDFLIEISLTTPFVLCIDDIHLAASGTLRFVELLSKKIEKSRIFLCITSRLEAAKSNGKLNLLFDRLKSNPAFCQLQLKSFSLEETKEYLASKFLGADLPAELVSYIYHYTSGNLFFMTELAKYLIKSSIIILRDGRWEFDLKNLYKLDVPRKVETVIWDNIKRYDRNVIRLLSLASVIGERFDLRYMRHLSGYDEEAILLVIFLLLRDRLLRKTTDPSKGGICYEFSSKSLQSLLYEKINRKTKAELHHRVAVLLENDFVKGKDQPVEEVAYHYNRTQDHLKACHFSLLAAKKAKEKFANRQTLMYLSKALRSSRLIKGAKERQYKQLEILAERGDLYRETGKSNKALESYISSLTMARLLKDANRIAYLCRRIGATYQNKRSYKQGIVYLKEALRSYRILKAAQGEADTLNELGITHWINFEYGEALNYYRKALGIMSALHNNKGQAKLLNNTGLIYRGQGKYKKCLDYFRRFLKVARRLQDSILISNALNNLGVAYWGLGKYDLAESYYLEALKVASKIGDQKLIYDYLHNLGDVAQRKGELDKALEYNVQSLSSAKKAEIRTGQALQYVGMTKLEMGKYSEAKRYLEESMEATEQTKDLESQTETLMSLSRLYSLLGHKKHSERYLLRSANLWRKVPDKQVLSSLYCEAGLIELQMGHFKEALQYLNRARKLVERLKIKEREIPLKMAYLKLYGKLDEKNEMDRLLKETGNLMRKREEQLYEPEYYLCLGKREWEKGKANASLKES